MAEFSSMKLVIYFVIAAVIIATIYGMYTTLIRQQEPYQLAVEFEGFSGHYASLAADLDVQDLALDEIYTGEECSSEGGLDKCFEELGGIMNTQGLFMSQDLLSRARHVYYCKDVVDKMMADCEIDEDFDENKCYASRDKYVEECYEL